MKKIISSICDKIKNTMAQPTCEISVTPSNALVGMISTSKVTLFVPQTWCFSVTKNFTSLSKKEAYNVEHIATQVDQISPILMKKIWGNSISGN